ncbi:MAG: recombinase family protein [Pseudomonadota bacterium]|nr:recombinase family protein [Pseudomonadota bacterium]
MMTENISKISAQHLRRDAFLYVRQSTLRQVLENTESTQRQYALRDRAVALGWPVERIHTIDEDLGISGAHAENRDGFQRLVSEVALGHAGIVLGLEVSRLARNNADWQRLLELCALSGSLISDEDGVYDPAHFNDRLLLGLKGTMSEAELHILKARLQGGMRNKARRGELQMPLPIGLVYDAAGAVVLDPDRQIEHTVRLLFSTFREVSSASATVRRFAREGLKFPHRVQSGSAKGEVLWEDLEHARVLQVLHNPRYAGAFVFGRTRSQRTADLKSTSQVLVPREQWMVFIPNAHVGYIALEEFERNQATLKQNLAALSTEGRGTVPREGIALLQGRVLCGRCGARMRVRYQQFRDRLIPYYVCTDAVVRRAGKSCQSIRGSDIDDAVSELLLKTLAPAALNVALAVQTEIAGRIEKADTLRHQQVERARYEAELKRRRFLKCDPDHRLVADALEADWNDQLRRLEMLQQEHDRQRKTDQNLLNEAARAQILSLARDFPRVWNDARTESRERKRMLALLIEDVTLTKYDPIAVHVRFRGGQTTSLTVHGPKPIALVRKFKPEVISQLDQLLQTCTDQEAADRLNALGYRNWKHQPFTRTKVISLRVAYKLPSPAQRLREQGFVLAEELARRLNVSSTTIHEWGRAGWLCRKHYGNRQCLFEPIKSVNIRKGKGGRLIPSFVRPLR